MISPDVINGYDINHFLSKWFDILKYFSASLDLQPQYYTGTRIATTTFQLLSVNDLQNIE